MARNFTPEQEEKIFDNVRKIEEYLRELQTQIDEPICVYFDQYVNGHPSLDKLYVGKNFMYIYVNEGNNRYFSIDDVKRPIWYSKLFSTCIYDDVSFALYLITNWECIKKLILCKITVQNERRERIDKAINEFKV